MSLSLKIRLNALKEVNDGKGIILIVSLIDIGSVLKKLTEKVKLVLTVTLMFELLIVKVFGFKGWIKQFTSESTVAEKLFKELIKIYLFKAEVGGLNRVERLKVMLLLAYILTLEIVI